MKCLTSIQNTNGATTIMTDVILSVTCFVFFDAVACGHIQLHPEQITLSEFRVALAELHDRCTWDGDDRRASICVCNAMGERVDGATAMMLPGTDDPSSENNPLVLVVGFAPGCWRVDITSAS